VHVQPYRPEAHRRAQQASSIGPKTAQRLAFHLLKLSPEEALPLAQALVDVKETVHFCTVCFNLTEQELCSICADPARDTTTICVVEEPGMW